MIGKLATSLSRALLVGAITFLDGAAHAQTVISPPAACIATIAPVYYEGRASYWCGDNWYYWNSGAWGFYDNEPAFLRGYRGNHGPARAFYGRTRAGGGARAGGGGGRAGSGGGRAGGGGHR
jgi:hypothetical protein